MENNMHSPIGARRVKTDLLTSESVFCANLLRSRSNSPATSTILIPTKTNCRTERC